MIDLSERFDGAAHWARLSDADRNAIGAAALEWMAAEHVQDRGYENGLDANAPTLERIGMAAVDACRVAIQEVFVFEIPREALETASGGPRVPGLLGMVCAACGCSEQDACPEGCGWARDNLCTACADRAAMAAA